MNKQEAQRRCRPGKTGSPPRFAEWLLQHVTERGIRYSAMGDFQEYFLELVKTRGRFWAQSWYWLHILRSTPAFVSDSIYWSIIMLKSYFKIAVRKLLKHRVYSLINITGLTVGIACAMLILLWVQDELSYDRFHSKADRISRVTARGTIGDTHVNQTYTPAPLTSTLQFEFPYVENAVRLSPSLSLVGEYEDKVFNEKHIVAADSTIFEVFSFPLLKGDTRTALVEPNTVVLSEATAQRYFGDEEPLGKVIAFAGRGEFRVTGVAQNVPENSHVHFDFLLSMSTFRSSTRTSWGNNSFLTYIVLKEGYSPDELQTALPGFVDKYVYSNLQHLYGEDAPAGNFWSYTLQPLTEIHLNSDLTGEFEVNGNATYVTVFAIVAFMILILACLNFINLTTARSANRAKEVGLRKVVGSTRKQLVVQHMTESLTLVFIAFGCGIALLQLALPYLNAFIGKSLELRLLGESGTLLNMLGLLVLVAILSGSYPAFYLTSFRPIAVISGRLGLGMKHSALRNSLVVFQFATTIAVFIGTVVIGKQLDYFQNKRLGFNKDQVLVITNPGSLGDRSSAFKEALGQNAAIASVSGSFTVPGRTFNNLTFYPEDRETVSFDLCGSSPEFIDVMQLEMAEGRFFSREFATDSTGIILNETAVTLLGWQEPLGKTFRKSGRTYTVIGVVRDFHYESLHSAIRPMALLHIDAPFRLPERYISARVETANLAGILNTISETWESMAGGKPFEYFFLDEDYGALYKNEMQTSKIFIIFSILAVVISGLGLLGLALYTADQRTKEFGIRKVLGATESNIFVLLSREFLKWVVISNFLAWPSAYLLMNQWLQDFAYRVSIGWAPFALSGLLALAIAFVTVSYQSSRAALANPVESLRYE